MVTIQVNDMTCGRCAGAISRAIAALDKAARLDIRIQQKLVRVDSAASVPELADAIRDAGYTPQEVRDEPTQAAAAPVRSGRGCGCGSRKAEPVDARHGGALPGNPCCG